MRRLLVVGILLLAGCGQNPVGPGLDAPPVVTGEIETLDQLALRLNTPAKAVAWLRANVTYGEISKEYEAGMGDPELTTKWAKSLFEEVKAAKGSGKGVCRHYAGFFLYCMRINGIRAGGIYHHDGSFPLAHVLAWVVEPDGSVSWVDVGAYSYKRYPDIPSFIVGLGRFKSQYQKEGDSFSVLDVNLLEVKETSWRSYVTLGSK